MLLLTYSQFSHLTERHVSHVQVPFRIIAFPAYIRCAGIMHGLYTHTCNSEMFFKCVEFQGFCPYVWVAVIEDGMNMSKIVLT